MADVDELANVRRMVRLLPVRYRHVIRLRYKDGMNFKEIGKLLDRSHQWANQVHDKAIERLRDYAGVEAYPQTTPKLQKHAEQVAAKMPVHAR